MDGLTEANFRALLADTFRLGPNSAPQALATLEPTAYPEWLTNAGVATLLGTEVAAIIQGGSRSQIPVSLKTLMESRRFISQNATSLRNLNQPMLGFLDAVAVLDEVPTRILDIGAGNGANVSYALTRYPEATVTGIDLDDSALRRANDRLNKIQRARFRPIAGDVTNMPFPNNQSLITAGKAFPSLGCCCRKGAKQGSGGFGPRHLLSYRRTNSSTYP
jgi:SAM-dependent methyltransferase